MRSPTEVGRDVPMRITRQVSGTPSGRFGFHRHEKKPVLRVAGRAFTLGISGSGQSGTRRGSGRSSGARGTVLRWGHDLPDDLTLGQHAGEVELSFAWTDGARGPEMVAWTEVHPVTFALVEPGADVALLVADPMAGSAFEGGLRAKGGRVAVLAGGDQAMLELEMDSVPVAVGYRVELRRGDRTWPVGTLASPPRPGHFGWGMGFAMPAELKGGETVELVLTPDAEVVRETVDLTEVLDHPLVVRGVKVVR